MDRHFFLSHCNQGPTSSPCSLLWNLRKFHPTHRTRTALRAARGRPAPSNIQVERAKLFTADGSGSQHGTFGAPSLSGITPLSHGLHRASCVPRRDTSGNTQSARRGSLPCNHGRQASTSNIDGCGFEAQVIAIEMAPTETVRAGAGEFAGCHVGHFRPTQAPTAPLLGPTPSVEALEEGFLGLTCFYNLLIS